MELNTYSDRLSKALKVEHSKIFENDGSLKHVFSENIYCCPVCENHNSKVYCIKDMFVHRQCKNCNFVYLNPRLNHAATVAFYNSEVNEIYNEMKFHNLENSSSDDAQNLQNYQLLKNHILNVKGKKLLEIGPGKGTFLARAANDGFEVYAIELNILLIELLRKITDNIYNKDILELDLPNDYFDVIYFRDVMEHIPDVSSFLNKVRKVLKPGGIVFIDTHNIDSLINRATRQYHTVIFAFEHPVHWSPKTLALAGERAGLTPQKVYFTYSDFSLSRIIHYYLVPSFTYIYPPQRSKFSKFILSKILRIIELRPVQYLDILISKFLARITKKGAKMQFFFIKK
jgi:2-polyprenyl-3-methyl-5-hydroxy-6-metoxy-1,4-benzoquinol methylase